MSKKILITGASGFVGRKLSDSLSRGFEVVSCSKKELDLLDRESVSVFLEEEKFDIVIHTATYDAAPEFSTKNPDKVFEYNFRMFDNLARCEEHYEAMIYFGSGAEQKRENQYGLSKYAMDQVAQNKSKIYNLRLYSVYGIGTDWRYRFINNACAKVALGMPIRVPRIGKCDYLHIDDLASVVEFYIHNFKDLPKTSDICSGDVLSPEEIIQQISQSGAVVGVERHNKVGSTVSRSKSCSEDYFGDTGFIKSLSIKLTPTRDGIRELIDFYKHNQPDPKEFVY